MLQMFEDMFWATATQAVKLFVPIISIIIIVKIIDMFIIKGSD